MRSVLKSRVKFELTRYVGQKSPIGKLIPPVAISNTAGCGVIYPSLEKFKVTRREIKETPIPLVNAISLALKTTKNSPNKLIIIFGKLHTSLVIRKVKRGVSLSPIPLVTFSSKTRSGEICKTDVKFARKIRSRCYVKKRGLAPVLLRYKSLTSTPIARSLTDALADSSPPKQSLKVRAKIVTFLTFGHISSRKRGILRAKSVTSTI